MIVCSTLIVHLQRYLDTVWDTTLMGEFLENQGFRSSISIMNSIVI